MKSKKKRAFTLTELLIVVIVIGVLSAVVLPKFSKVIETRKTTEAEEIMAAVRTEQEQRCSLNKLYTNDFAKLKNALPSNETQNYTYNLSGASISATSKGSLNYTLKMPSFADGRICCDTQAEGNQCDKLNKDYPACNELIARADYTQAEAECTPPITCLGESTQACGCNNSGTQTRTCDTTTGMWGAWGACQGTHCDCAPDAYGMATSKSCNCNGTQTRTCNTSNGTWSQWSSCSGYTEPGRRMKNYTPVGKSPRNCASAEEIQGCDYETHQWSWAQASMGAHPDESACCSGAGAGGRMVNFTPTGAEPVNCGSRAEEQRCVDGRWQWQIVSEDTSECHIYEWVFTRHVSEMRNNASCGADGNGHWLSHVVWTKAADSECNADTVGSTTQEGDCYADLEHEPHSQHAHMSSEVDYDLYTCQDTI